MLNFVLQCQNHSQIVSIERLKKFPPKALLNSLYLFEFFEDVLCGFVKHQVQRQNSHTQLFWLSFLLVFDGNDIEERETCQSASSCKCRVASS